MTGSWLSKLLHPLDMKVLRQLWRMKSQVIAIAAVVLAGVAVQVMMRGAVHSLEVTRDAYYDRYRMPDIFVPVKRSPDYLTQRAAGIPGVAMVQDRVQVSAIMQMPNRELGPVKATVISIPEITRPAISDLYLTAGRWIDGSDPDEAIILESFLIAHKMKVGDKLTILLNGKKRFLRVVGTAKSPEFVYPIPPGELVPDEARFAVVWMGREALAQAYDLEGAFNQLLVTLQRNASEDRVIEALDRIFEKYGGVGAYGVDEHVSNMFLSNEIEQLGAMSKILPPIFLSVAAFLLYVVVSRIVETEREQIGLLKAFGYSDFQLSLHYGKLLGTIVGIGLIAGWVVGTRMGNGLANLYQTFFQFPILLFEHYPGVYLSSGLTCMISAAVGGFAVIRKVVNLQPAEAMRPPVPPDYSGGFFARFLLMIHWLDQPTRLILRHLARWPKRALLTLLGISLAMGVRVAAQQSWDAVDHMLVVSFEVQNRYDLSVNFIESQNFTALDEIENIKGVLKIEPFRMVAGKIKIGQKEEIQSIIGLPYGGELAHLLDENEHAVDMPVEGLVLSRKLAETLDVKEGDVVQFDATQEWRPTLWLPIAKLVDPYLGTPAYINLKSLNNAMPDGPRISGVHLSIDQNLKTKILDKLESMPKVMNVTVQMSAAHTMKKKMGEMIGTAIFFNVIFSSLIAIGIVYNSARISLSERSRELASLRVLGFSKGEVAYILLGELAILVLLSLPVGAGIGYFIALQVTEALSSDLFRIPATIFPATFGWAAVTIVGAAVVAAIWVSRSVGQLKMVEALKSKD